MRKVTDLLTTVSEVFFAPKSAVSKIKDRTGWFWFPLTLIIGSSILLYVWYFGWVDFDWMRAQLLEEVKSSGASDEELDIAAKFLLPRAMLISSLVGIVLITLAVTLIWALFLHIVNKVQGDVELRYGVFLSLVSWSMPGWLTNSERLPPDCFP